MSIETWTPTINLRINYLSVGHVDQGCGHLQQEFICVETGKTEWRNVPISYQWMEKKK